ncbi:preprotein translocase subunit YajC [Anaerotignum propionicum]|uniref:Preprotein translocase subunit YajC n=1 Tax=Anaerotignum propionicum DSM 1682 TaxID=991789 RepID=A0A0X1U875_ANAPI|nr:preprotein translocase subunit YajC [Anaerotignum propionicum]AMJ41133.1 preprotein translocase subunit YajC [Anaerotignum propionicum DSM 1682]MEA5057663.1 preprotein translocase subunit YajC [Anaerotignum propionicum]SHE64306.1 preprotein translocase, YajC subunit [[Clostridium] propionicum DSM 1682] [Anaerotignum propionicum DSM 1682]
MSFVPFLLDTSTTILPSSGGTAAAPTTSAGGNIFGSLAASNPVMLIVLYCILLVGVMYFLSVRPNQKREKQMAEMRSSIAVGDSIVTNSGLFGKVVDITYECFIIEFGMNKGVRVPVVKGEVFGKREPNLSNEAPPQAEQPKKKKSLFSRGEEN